MFDWLKKKKPTQNEATTLARTPALQKMVLTDDLEIRTRKVRIIARDYAAAIRAACQKEPSLAAAYVLDLRRPDNDGQWLMIELALDNPKRISEVAERFGTALASFPDWTRTYLRGADSKTVERMKGAEFYTR